MAVRTATFRGRPVGPAGRVRHKPVGRCRPRMAAAGRLRGEIQRKSLDLQRSPWGYCPTSSGRHSPTGTPRVPREGARADTKLYDALSVHCCRMLTDALSEKSKRCAVGPQVASVTAPAWAARRTAARHEPVIQKRPPFRSKSWPTGGGTDSVFTAQTRADRLDGQPKAKGPGLRV